MCRLYFNPGAMPNVLNLLEDRFTALEAAAGGQGNGLALLSALKPPEIVKGVRVKCRELAERAIEHGGPFIFHTRIASIGPVCDELCQPFLIPQSTVIAHNGHWGDWRTGLDILLRNGKLRTIPLNISDSWVGARLARTYGIGALAHYITSGVWLWSAVEEGKLLVFAVVNTGEFTVNKNTGEGASEPTYWSTTDTIWTVGDKALVQLYPRLRVVYGSVWDWPPKKRKGGKK